MRPVSALTGASAFLLLLIGIVEIALIRHGDTLTRGFELRGTSDLSGGLSGEVNLNLLPEHYNKGSTRAILAAGAVTTIAGFVGLVDAVWGSRKSASAAFYTTIAIGFFSTLSVLVTAIALIYAMVAESQSSTWQYTGTERSSGEYTVEGWACQMKHVILGRQDTFSKVCTESMAARFITIPMLICGVALIFATLWEAKTRRHVIRPTVQGKNHELESM